MLPASAGAKHSALRAIYMKDSMSALARERAAPWRQLRALLATPGARCLRRYAHIGILHALALRALTLVGMMRVADVSAKGAPRARPAPYAARYEAARHSEARAHFFRCVARRARSARALRRMRARYKTFVCHSARARALHGGAAAADARAAAIILYTGARCTSYMRER